MKFGALPDRLLAAADLRLPPSPVRNEAVLTGVRAVLPKAYVGAARWGDAAWVGKVYPPKTPATQFRQLYPQYFNATELNATHYNTYPAEVLQQWAAAATGKDFKFCPKFPQAISHYSQFQNTEAATAAFLQSIDAFGEQLGPAFLQLSESYAPSGKKALFEYLADLPKDKTFFLEVRHPQWFTPRESEELFATLQALGIGAVITDAPGRRDAAHMHLSIPKLMLRFVCNGLHATSYSRTDAWAAQLQQWIDKGLEETYVFLHPGNDAVIPELATYWVQQLNEKCRLQLKPPASLQGALF